MERIDEFAPAKVNLTLHVTGRREDGYHLLDSLVVFADIGDWISAAAASSNTLTVTGPRSAGVPSDGSNLVLKAAALMAESPAAITLDKQLPAASGIGGGSADAAATLRALARLHDHPVPEAEAVLRLGADVPVCLAGRAVRMSGIGEELAEVPPLPPLPAVLVNPGVEVSTPEVFRRLERRDNPPMPGIPEGVGRVAAFAKWLKAQRNDLEAPACAVAPEVAQVLDRLWNMPGNLLARMSGSGATCFGLFEDTAAADSAAASLRRAEPGWWVRACTLS